MHFFRSTSLCTFKFTGRAEMGCGLVQNRFGETEIVVNSGVGKGGMFIAYDTIEIYSLKVSIW